MLIGFGLYFLGLVLATMFSLPPSFCIVTIACTIWLVVRLTGRSRQVQL